MTRQVANGNQARLKSWLERFYLTQFLCGSAHFIYFETVSVVDTNDFL